MLFLGWKPWFGGICAGRNVSRSEIIVEKWNRDTYTSPPPYAKNAISDEKTAADTGKVVRFRPNRIQSLPLYAKSAITDEVWPSPRVRKRDSGRIASNAYPHNENPGFVLKPGFSGCQQAPHAKASCGRPMQAEPSNGGPSRTSTGEVSASREGIMSAGSGTGGGPTPRGEVSAPREGITHGRP